MIKKKVLIFGGGINQLTLIKACNRLGYTSVVVDPNQNAPGKEFADIFYVVEPNDYQKTKEIATLNNVSGIATTQMENPLRLMSRLAQEMNLIFNKPDILEQSLDKYLMKQKFRQSNIPHAKGVLFYDTLDINKDKLVNFGYPLIVKPVDAFSSRGVFLVSDWSELIEKASVSITYSKKHKILVEEFIEGPEFSIESFTYDGETTIVQYTEKFVTPFPETVEIGHLQPANLSIESKFKINKVVTDAIQSLGLNNTVTHAELKLTSIGPVIIEIGPRGGGDFISSYLTKYSTNFDFDEAIIQLALGNKPEYIVKKNKYSYIKYFNLRPNLFIKHIEDYTKSAVDHGLIYQQILLKVGEVTELITHSGQRTGFVIVYGDSRDTVIELAASFEQKLINKIQFEEYRG